MATHTDSSDFAPPDVQAPSGAVALGLGIVGVFIAPPVLSVFALYFGYRSRREAEADPHRYVDGYGRAARILGWVGVAIGIVLSAVIVAVRR